MTVAYAFDSIFLEHDDPQHIERRDRLERILEVLRAHGVLERAMALPVEPIPMERLTRVHQATYVERVRRLAERGGGGLNFPGDETYVTPRSFEAALRAAGAVESPPSGKAGPAGPSPWSAPPAITPSRITARASVSSTTSPWEPASPGRSWALVG